MVWNFTEPILGAIFCFVPSLIIFGFTAASPESAVIGAFVASIASVILLIFVIFMSCKKVNHEEVSTPTGPPMAIEGTKTFTYADGTSRKGPWVYWSRRRTTTAATPRQRCISVTAWWIHIVLSSLGLFFSLASFAWGVYLLRKYGINP